MIIVENMSGYSFKTTNDDVYEFTMEVAQGLKTYEVIKKWFNEKSRKKE